MSFWKKYGYKILLVLAFILIVIYFSFVTDRGFIPTGENLKVEHWLGFWAGFLSFAGSLFLGAVALWQNDRANEMNGRLISLQEKQLGANKGILFPLKNEEKLRQFYVMKNIEVWEEDNTNKKTGNGNLLLRVILQNRGNDIIHECYAKSATINDNPVILPSSPIVIELDEYIYFDIIFNDFKNHESEQIKVEIEIDMQNTCRVKYTEFFTATLNKINDRTYSYHTYNYKINEEKINEQ